MSKATVEYKGDALFEGVSGKHSVKMDLPASMKGKDRAMTPTELFAVSLAGYVNALVVSYCREMKIQSDGLVVTLEYDKWDQPNWLGYLRIHIKMPGKDWEAHKDGILRAAERCPVHETIFHHHPLAIEIK